MSLLLATCTWFFVKGITSDWRLIEGVPLEVKARTGLTVLQASAATVNVIVRGTREDVRQVSRQDLSAVVDLSQDNRVGPITVKLTPKSIRHSRRVQVSEIDPPEVTVNVDQMIERELPVQPQFSGELPPNLSVERVLIEPKTIRERGPKTLLNSMTTCEHTAHRRHGTADVVPRTRRVGAAGVSGRTDAAALGGSGRADWHGSIG